jgi:YggT family protein
MPYTAIAALDLVARVLVVVALVYSSVVALTHWAVRSRRITPFGVWPRFVRRASDPVLLPLERRVIRAGGSPQDAPLWLVGIVVAGGLLLLSLVAWLHGFVGTLGMLVESGPRAWGRFLLSGLFTLLMAALFVRVIASWFGISPYARWMRPVMILTDWIVEPIRRILPPLGMIDFSPLVAWLVLTLLRGFLLSLL